MTRRGSVLAYAKTAALAFATVVALHLALGGLSAQATSAAGCPHGACTAGGGCAFYANHGCCFSIDGTQCESYSCLLQPDGCP